MMTTILTVLALSALHPPHEAPARNGTPQGVEYRIEVVRDYGDTPAVECYPHQLNQVFMNLVLNAAQAIKERGTITVRTRAVDGAVRIEIQDTGAGIPDEHRERIFEPGFTTKGNRVGMGLGLLTSRQIVDRHHGRIDVESQVGRGTTFAVTVPVRMPAETGEPTGERADGEPAEERTADEGTEPGPVEAR
jgi:two-component system, NtrC family, sensor kinase